MRQTKLLSFIESIANTFFSYVVGIIVGHFVYGYFKLPIDLQLNMKITALFLAASLIRSYLIRRFFNSFVPAHPSTYIRTPIPESENPGRPVEYKVPDSAEIQHGLDVLKNFTAGVMSDDFRDQINRVQCPIKFPGWGYIAGASKGLWINNDLVICAGDNDLHKSEICVVIKGQAAILVEVRLEESDWTMRVTPITQELNGALTMRYLLRRQVESVEEFRQLPGHIQEIMIDVLLFLIKRHEKIKEAQAKLETDVKDYRS